MLGSKNVWVGIFAEIIMSGSIVIDRAPQHRARGWKRQLGPILTSESLHAYCHAETECHK